LKKKKKKIYLNWMSYFEKKSLNYSDYLRKKKILNYWKTMKKHYWMRMRSLMKYYYWNLMNYCLGLMRMNYWKNLIEMNLMSLKYYYWMKKRYYYYLKKKYLNYCLKKKSYCYLNLRGMKMNLNWKKN